MNVTVYARTYGGAGGGGDGAVYITTTPYSPTRGQPNTGGGGGGSSGRSFSGAPYASAAGGSGIVVIRYPANFAQAKSTTGSPLTYKTGFYRVYVFVASGTITF
jgi:hypothetical protein